jgi:hydroxysqualene dehydroxylase
MTLAPGRGPVHVVGAGLAGLSAAVELALSGCPVTLYEAGPHAGGRCRSYFDNELGCRIDNGNHLVLAGNAAAMRYLERTGGLATFEGPSEAAFPFIDVATDERWTLRPNRGAVPWWITRSGRRVPGSRARDYLAALRLRDAPASATVAEIFGEDLVARRLWLPLAVSALNTQPEQASAQLFWRLLRDTLGRGAAACRPLVPRDGLSESLVDPALTTLRKLGGEIRFGARLKALEFADDRVSALEFDRETVPLGAGDGVIMAMPAPVAGRLVPELTVPDQYSPIVNAHFRCDAQPNSPPFIGVVGGAAEWVFRKRGVLAVTVSAADRLVDLSAEELRALLWRDVAVAYDLPPEPLPPARILKERRATFLASPAQLRRRPPARTRWTNLLLAGDYTDTGLPATIEGAIRSGLVAAQDLLHSHRVVPPVIALEHRRIFGEKQQYRGLR